MAPQSSLRASDADRDAVVERLRRAAVEGRLQPEELEERLHAALRARTYGDLKRVLRDLPTTRMAWERQSAVAMPAASTVLAVAMRVGLMLAIMAVVLVVAAAMAAWWILWAVVCFALCGRRFSGARLGARSPWDRRATRRQRRRVAQFR
jgi:hypothetical protein